MIRLRVSSLAVLTAVPLLGCSSLSSSLFGSETKTVYRESERIIERSAETPPGTVQHVWEEPMADVIDIPAGLDPEGVYYRPTHREIVEIRQGKWRLQRLKSVDGQ